MAQTVKNPLSMQEIWVQSLAWEDPLEEGMVTHYGILAWRALWTEEPGGLQAMGSQRVVHDLLTSSLDSFKVNSLTMFLLGLVFCCIHQ